MTINQPERWVIKPQWQRANNIESQPLPQTDRASVRRQHHVKLHRRVAQRAGRNLGMVAHLGGNAPALRGRCSDIATIADMARTTVMVGLDKIGAQNRIIVRDISRSGGIQPQGARSGLRYIAVYGVGFTCAKHRTQDAPDRRPIGISGGTDLQASAYAAVDQPLGEGRKGVRHRPIACRNRRTRIPRQPCVQVNRE
jgi:uncharacterized metal-binding protein